MKTALLVIDIQQVMIDEHPANEETFLSNVAALISAAHACGKEVIYVRHDGGVGDPLEKGTPGWQLFSSLHPAASEQIFDKQYSSAFKGTGLREYLAERGVEQLMICGMQTEYCIDSSVKAAFEHGFSVLIPSGATTTYANPFLTGERLIAYYEKMIWHLPLAKVVSMDEALHLLQD
jgi:nicotinamidase-related amidase